MKKSSIKEFRLANGLTLIHLHTKRDPVSACHLFLPGGGIHEPETKSGLATLRWSLLLKGTAKRTARELAEDIESLGASIGGGATHDYSEISCHAASEYFLKTLRIMAEALFEPAFTKNEIKKEKEALIAAIRSKKESIFSIASEKLNKELYGSHPYSRPASGNETSISNLTADDLFQWNKEYLSPVNAILAVATDIPFSTLKKEIMTIFGASAWPRPKKTVFKKINSTTPISKSISIQLREKFEQAYLMIGFPASPVNATNYMAVKLLNACLGGGMSTRLFQELREKQGLAYDVGSYFPSKMYGSAFVIYLGLQTERIPQAKKQIQEILEEIREEGIPSTEIDMMKNYLKGTYLLDHQTNSQRAHYLGWWRILGKPAAFDTTYIDRIGRVRPRDVLKAARDLFSNNSVTIEIHPSREKIHA